MSVQGRKERERANRRQMIVLAARTLAEAEGWEAVTIRRLAEHIEYSQPVLYSHFAGKDDIVGAVALEGFMELTGAIRSAVPSSVTGRAAVAALAGAYLAFAERHPEMYDAMFNLKNGLQFADPATPAPLREGFAALLETLGTVAGAANSEVFTEVCWAALHGLATLTRTGRLPPQGAPQRLAVLVNLLVSD